MNRIGSSVSGGAFARRCAVRAVLLTGIVCATVLAMGASAAFANMSGLTLNAPSITTVNSSATYGASVVLAAAPFIGSPDTLDSLVFTLPENTDLTGLTTGSFTLSKGSVSTFNVVDDGTTRTLTVNLTGATGALWLGGDTTITISFPAHNPSVGGTYGASNHFQVVASGTGGPLTATRTYALTSYATSPTLGTPTLGNPVEWAATTMDVPVTVGSAGRLDANATPGNVTTPNQITVTFPAGYVVPVAPAATSVTIQGVALDTAPSVMDRSVTMNIPSGVTIADGGTATVSFLPSFGMTNPSAGTYVVTATTDIQSGAGSSLPYTVTPVSTTLNVVSANQPPAGIVVRGETRAVGGFTMQCDANPGDVAVSSITVDDTATTPASTVAGVDVYRDNGDGSYGAGDSRLNGVAGVFTGPSALVTLTSAESVATAVQQYWIVYTFSGAALDGATASARVSAVAHTAGTLSNTSAAGSAFEVDAASPNVSVTVPASDGALVGGVLPPFAVMGVATDGVSGVASVSLEIQRSSDSFYWNGLSWQPSRAAVAPTTSNGWLGWTYPWGFSPSVQDGTVSYTFNAYATDGVGATGQASRSDVRFDNVVPATSCGVTPVSPDGAAGWYRTVPSVALSRNEAGTTYYKWDGAPSLGDQTAYSGALTAPQGTHILYYYSVDSAGNAETVGTGPALKVDSIVPTAPTASASMPTSTSVEVSWSGAADSGSGIAVYTVYEGGAVVATTAGSSATIVVAAGSTHTYTAKAADVAGNVSAASNSVTAGTEGTEPVTTLTAVPGAADGLAGWYVTTPSISLAADVPSTTRYQWDGLGGWTTYGGAFTPAQGTHVLSFFSVSADSVTEPVNTRTFKVDTTAPSTPDGVGATSPTPSSVTVSWAVSTDSVSGVSNYDVVNTDLDTVACTVTGTSATVTGLTPSTTYHFAVVARDVAGHVSSRSSAAVATTQDAIVVDPGDDVSASWGGIRVIFTRILVGGTLDITSFGSDPHPAPPGFRLLSTCNYDISTTASHEGTVTVIMPYDPSIAGADESQLRLFHWEDGSWVDVTDSVDMENNEITGHTDGSLSPFGVGAPSAGAGALTPASSPWSMALLLVSGICIAGPEAVRRRRVCGPDGGE